MSRSGKLALACVLGVVSWGAGAARAALTCQEVGGDPARPTTLRLVLESPADGSVVEPTTGCGGTVRVAGTFLVDAPPLLYDFHVVLDASGSTDADSGTDVDGDGVLGERADSIYQAEISAAQAFVRALDPATARVAVIVFNRGATVRQQLTADLAAALAVLEALRGDRPRFGTGYVPAMEAVRLEMLARGDRAARLQRCVFLSDGRPDETLAQTDAKAAELAALGLVIDGFALGFPDSEALRSMAAITGGRFTALAVPGDIVDLLPSFVPDVPWSLRSREDGTGLPGSASTDDVAGTFEAWIPLRPGPNRVTLTLAAGGSAPLTVTCSLDLSMPEALVADAGPARRSCGGGTVTLDASSSFAACASPRFRWLDCAGAVLQDWSPRAVLDVDPCALPCADVRVELSCPGDACVASASAVAACLAVPAPAPALAGACGLTARLACGSADPALDATWDVDPLDDSDGDGDAANDADVPGCDVEVAFPSPGMRSVVAQLADRATGCRSATPLDVLLAPLPAARDLAGGVCPGAIAAFSCGTAEPGTDYWWDFDDASDADFDGDASNDRDAAGCDAAHAWASSGTPAVHGWAETAGCRRLLAAGRMDVSAGARPGEAQDLRVAREGGAVLLSWAPVPGAMAHRVLRGSVRPLQARGLYDHAADDAASRGACDVRGPASFTDPDDAADPEAFYYLVTAVSPCAGDGPAGFGFDGRSAFDRPDRLPTAGCP